MGRYALRRGLTLLAVLFVIAVVLYGSLRLTSGGPQSRFAGARGVTSEEIDAWLKAHCLSPENRRAPQVLAVAREFGGWFGAWNCETDSPFTPAGGLNVLPADLGGGTNGVVHGDLGRALDTGEPVTDRILDRVPTTLLLTVPALLLSIGLSVWIGVYGALRRRSLADQILGVVSYIGFSLPTFWVATLGLQVFAWDLGWLPVHGLASPFDWPPYGTDAYWAEAARRPVEAGLDLARHLVLPVGSLVLFTAAADNRFVRSSLLEALDQDYVRTARAKGLDERVVVLKHGLRNALIPFVTRIGLQIPVVFTGSIVIEPIFGIPGMGRLFIEVLRSRDYFTIMGIVLVASVLILVANYLTDLAYGWLDPRIRARA